MCVCFSNAKFDVCRKEFIFLNLDMKLAAYTLNVWYDMIMPWLRQSETIKQLHLNICFGQSYIAAFAAEELKTWAEF